MEGIAREVRWFWRRPVVGTIVALLLLSVFSCNGSEPIEFSVERLDPVVYTGSSSGSMSAMASAGPESLPKGHRVSTDANGQALLEGLLSNNKTCQIYVFQLSSLTLKACSRSSYEGSNTATCQEENTAVYKECKGNLQMTPTGEVEVAGSWVSLTYLPGQRLTLVIVADGQARVHPVTEYGSPKLGEPITLGERQFLYTAPDDVLRSIAGLPPRRPLPVEELPPLVEALGIEPWIDQVIERSRQDDVPLVVEPRRDTRPQGLFVVRGLGGPLADERVQKAIASGVDWKKIIAESLAADNPVAILEFYDWVVTTDRISPDWESSVALLAEAGYPNGFTLLVLASQQDGELIDIAEWTSGFLSEIGLSTKFRVEPSEEVPRLIEQFKELDAPILWLAWE